MDILSFMKGMSSTNETWLGNSCRLMHVIHFWRARNWNFYTLTDSSQSFSGNCLRANSKLFSHKIVREVWTNHLFSTSPCLCVHRKIKRRSSLPLCGTLLCSCNLSAHLVCNTLKRVQYFHWMHLSYVREGYFDKHSCEALLRHNLEIVLPFFSWTRTLGNGIKILRHEVNSNGVCHEYETQRSLFSFELHCLCLVW